MAGVRVIFLFTTPADADRLLFTTLCAAGFCIGPQALISVPPPARLQPPLRQTVLRGLFGLRFDAHFGRGIATS